AASPSSVPSSTQQNVPGAYSIADCVPASVICLSPYSAWRAKTHRETTSVARRLKKLKLIFSIITSLCQIDKNGKRHLRQAESSAIRFLIIAEAFKRMAASHVHTRLPVLYPEDQLSVSLSSVSTRIIFTILASFRTRCR